VVILVFPFFEINKVSFLFSSEASKSFVLTKKWLASQRDPFNGTLFFTFFALTLEKMRLQQKEKEWL
tara:strand:+ start:11297 stop:11497 length:201 start_codon:yes stop_codon:yes gene_type:complete